jgi:uncharacterized protein (TIGR01777 family)
MKIVVAGGSGFIGRALCQALGDAGYQVVVLTRSSAKAAAFAGPGRAVVWQPPSAGDWTTELDGAGAVVNQPAGEDAAPADTFLARLCLDWEAEARRAEELGVRVVHVRTSSVIGRGAPYLRVVTLPFRLFIGGRIGSGRQWVSWVDLDDIVGLYRLAIESSTIHGPLNASAPDPRRQAEYAAAIGRALHRPSIIRTPAWAVRLVLGDQASLVLGSRRVWPVKAIAAGYVFRRPRLEASLAAALDRPPDRN